MTPDDPSAPTIAATGSVRTDVGGVTSIGAATVGTARVAEAALPSGEGEAAGNDPGDDPAGTGALTDGAETGETGVGAGADGDADGA